METIHDVVKGREPYWVSVDATVLEAVSYMVERNIGAVAVLQDDEVIGIFSERDLMQRVVMGHRSPGSAMVREVMTSHPYCVSPNESWEQCMFLMREHNFRHLLVTEDKKLVGVISLRDLLLRDATQKDADAKMIRSYIASQ